MTVCKWPVFILFYFILCVLQQEQVEWDDVNKRLQHHGFKPVFFADPAENKSPAGKNCHYETLSKVTCYGGRK